MDMVLVRRVSTRGPVRCARLSTSVAEVLLLETIMRYSGGDTGVSGYVGDQKHCIRNCRGGASRLQSREESIKSVFGCGFIGRADLEVWDLERWA